MRILMTSYEVPPVGGGGGQFAKELALRLAELGDEVDLVTMRFRCLVRVERFPGLTIHRVPSVRRNLRSCSVFEAASYLLGAMPVMAGLLQKRSYHVVHSHFILPDGLLGWYAARSAGLPFIVTAHGTDVPSHNPYRVRFLHKCLGPVWRRLTSRASRIVCPSRVLKLLVESANNHARTIIVPNGFDADRFSTGKKRANRILLVARLVESKGVQYLLRALVGFDGDYEVVLTGDGPYRSYLQKLADSLKVHVRFIGWVDNQSEAFRDLYEKSRIFVFPSEAENCPLVLMEAMSAGLAIITTRDTGCADVVGDAAILVPPRDPSSIRAALQELVSSPERVAALGAEARRRARRLFDWSTVVEQYREIYRRYGNSL
jgi:glycosyltransferase involved in cell wall biosynthesis